ncbi:DNA polymerase III subunit alpha [Paenibacillus sp. TCA20]|uniref:DNA polymerase III subunit alpha n=1 Tax=Paenibacillus sp. TCA20 TaxID=1499968 RepID=UPI0004D7624E|nr:DNA polymerase III subunit alpha [Paenibacillus sp. TCA20]GAK42126.1 DNA polymerase III subunit alpha [Paenibacillus sp. TCA20]
MINHLHVHCEYSELDGLSTVKDLVKRAKEIGSSALAITDHGVCGAIPDFITACKEEGIKPIPGCEAYMTKNRHLKSDFHKASKAIFLEKYGIKDKAWKAFRKAVRNNPDNFMLEARELLKDYIMREDLKSMASGSEEELDLFGFGMMEEEKPLVVGFSPDDALEDFRKEFYELIKHDNFHIVLMATNQQGLEDLYEIISDAHISGFYSNPRTDLAFIRDRGLGKHIIATSACLGSYLARFALAGDLAECRSFIQECKDTFHSFYLEKQATRIPEQIRLNEIIDQLALETNTPKIVTTDVHYANKDDRDIHDILVASSMNKCIHDNDRLIYAHEFWMKSEDEIREIINDDEAIENTLRIAELVDVDLPKDPLFPKYIVDENDTAEEQLEKLAWNRLFTYTLKTPIDLEQYSQQLQYELSVINPLGFADYFLIVSDYINWAKENGFEVGPGRGSAAGSLVAFVIGITTIDPIKWDLMFERFLNPERAGYPDIDVDFSYEGARAVQEYMKQKYGDLNVAQIGTYGTLAGRSVIRAVGKALGYSAQDQDRFAKSIPETPGITLDKYINKNGKEVDGAYQISPETRMYADRYPEWWQAAKALEGHVRSAGVHAGGIVLSPKPLTNTVPLRLDKEGLTTTQYDMEWIEKFLVKFDILKLSTLDLIKKTKQNAGIMDLDLNTIDFNDPKIYEEIYNKLNLSGIFQCESDLFRGIIKDMEPSNVEDISVIVALGRPGPLDLIPSYIRRKKGQERVTYPFDSLEPVLGKTYGIWVYQEQIMKASMILGGFTTGQSDILRKAISKKNHALMEEWINYMIYGSAEKDAELIAKGKEPLNIPGAISLGYDEATLLKIKEDWIKFGDYCFNYAHSACYAVLSVMTAYLKAYYPTEFMAALMTISEGKLKDGVPRNVAYMKECEEMGISILPPDINYSNDSWTPINAQEGEEGLGKILYGLASIAGVSSKDLDVITECRPFKEFDDFLLANRTMKLNKTKTSNLIKSGSFDTISDNRNLLLRRYFEYRGEEFEHMPSKTTKKDIIAYEREMLGTNVSIRSRWDSIEDGRENITFTGYIIESKPFTAKSSGKVTGKAKIETAEDELSLVIFNKIWSKNADDFIIGRKIKVVGKRSGSDLIVDKITYMDHAEQSEEEIMNQFQVEFS